MVLHSPVMVLHSPVMVLNSLVLVFTQSSFNFYTVQLYFFTQSSFIFLHSPVLFLHSPVFIFTQSSFNFYTIQFYFLHSPVLFLHSPVLIFTQSSFIFCVVTIPLSRYCNTCYLTAAILYFLATMDSIILRAVREELRLSSSTLTLLRQKSLIFLPCLRQNSNFHTLFKTKIDKIDTLIKMIKSIPCLRQKSRKNTLAGRTSLLSPYKGLVPPPRVLGSSF